MKPGALCFSVLAAAFFALTGTAWADRRPDFDNDAKPILKIQPHLLSYIKKHFDVEETGYAKTPGDDDHAPPPPYIFRAKHRGADGPDTITLLIQPGPPGHILLVKEDGPGQRAAMIGADETPPPAENQPPPPSPAYNQPQAPEPAASAPPPSSSTPASSETSSSPTYQTPSGPIKSDSDDSSGPSSSLTPPPDPAPNP